MRRFLIVILGLAATISVAAATDTLPSQAGLPPELTIAPQPPLATQLQTLQALAAWAEAHQPRRGLGDSLKRLFTRETRAEPVPAAWLLLTPDIFRTRLVAVSGIYTTGPGGIPALATEGGLIRLSLSPAVEIEGFSTKSLAGLPVCAEGIVESLAGVPQIRVAKLRPSYWLTLLRLARVQELLNQPEAAIKTYERAAMPAMEGGFAAFARTRAGLLAYDHRLYHQARTLLSAAWTAFAGSDRQGRPRAYTWVLTPDGSRWEKVPVTKALAEPLDAVNRSDFWYRFMDFFVTLAGNSRWLGIVLLGIVSRLIIWPLTKKQLASAQAMQRLQPQIRALQERYANDKQKFQEEFWRLCQANGVNPMGGCLPMLIQMPILIFLYKGIREYIVQFDGHSFLWIKNLAAPDIPLLVIYTLSMIAFQKMTQKLQPNPTMTPQQAQQQQMMTYMMPIMFFFFFQSFPAAFLLYWTVTNIVYFIQQYAYTLSLTRKSEMAAETPSPAAKPTGLTAAITRVLSQRAQDNKSPADKSAQEETRPSFHEKQAQARGKKPGKSGSTKRPRR